MVVHRPITLSLIERSDVACSTNKPCSSCLDMYLRVSASSFHSLSLASFKNCATVNASSPRLIFISPFSTYDWLRIYSLCASLKSGRLRRSPSWSSLNLISACFLAVLTTWSRLMFIAWAMPLAMSIFMPLTLAMPVLVSNVANPCIMSMVRFANASGL